MTLERKPQWTFLTNHTRVLLCCLSSDNSPTLREIANRIGLTERAVYRIIQELEQSDIIKRSRQGRRNSYSLNEKAKLQHPLEADCPVTELLDMIRRFSNNSHDVRLKRPV